MGGHHALAVAEAERQHLAHDEVAGDRPIGERVGLDARPQPRDVVAPELLGQIVEPLAERRVRGELGVHSAPGRRGGDHADVVEVRHQHGAALHHAAAVVRARREQAAVELLGEAGRPSGDVAHVDDAVVGERGRVRAGIVEERRVVEERLRRGRSFDGAPVPLLQPDPGRRRDEAVQLVAAIDRG